jgi:hypothetical protein
MRAGRASVAPTRRGPSRTLRARAFAVSGVTAALLLYGCTGERRTIALPKGELPRLISAPVIVSLTYAPPHFFVGGGWTVEDWRRGQMLQTTYGLADPTSRLQGRALDLLESSHGFKNFRRIDSHPASDELVDLKRLLGEVLLLDFKTVSWGLSGPEGGSQTIFVTYSARARLLDLLVGVVLWQGACRARGRDTNPYALTVGGEPVLLANKADLLKKESDAAVDACATDLLEQLSDGLGERS